MATRAEIEAIDFDRLDAIAKSLSTKEQPVSNIIPISPLLGAVLKRAHIGDGRRPMPKINALECSITLLDNQGRAAAGTLDPWGVPAFGTIAEHITADELFARVACLALLNGTPEQVLHNIISQESAIRASEYLALNKRSPAV